MIAERATSVVERSATFPCFGSDCTVLVTGPAEAAAAAVARCRQQLLEWHDQFSRFQPDSEITRLNDDPGESVQVSPMMRRVLQAAVRAANDTGGLVDPTLMAEIEQAGYAHHFQGSGIPLHEALRLAPARRPGRGRAGIAAWRGVQVQRRTGTVTRPPGLRLDAGGIAKGVFADELAASLSSFAAFVIDCAGDLRLGGSLGVERPVHVASPFDESVLHTFSSTRPAWPRAASAGGAGCATGAPPITCSIRAPARRPSPEWSRSPRWRRAQPRPSRSARRRCSAGPTAPVAGYHTAG